MVCTFAFGTLFLYDYFLTLRDEVHYVWKRQFSIATYIFFLLRYLAALFMTLVGLDLLIVVTFRLAWVQIWALMEKVVMIGWYFAFISFMALRIHAIWDFNIIVTSLVLIPGAFVIVWTLSRLLIVAKFVMVFGLRCNFTPLLGPDFPTMWFMLHLRQAQTGQPISETPSRLEAGFITHGSSLHFTGDLGTPFAVAVHEELEDDES
ncbi:hypothetical protein BXZ70DRAFT_906898 [Cristinia sonorae]|uniref:DUF6533 domain-containing protein n=1 Tax=Cristinia sonorae TaxID=1940300 RepID=A0A8K0UPK9_9AGAR|nr:hypothetical protein BXZ70DRAFT_906898 [Cristinia sonorae]